MKENKENAVYWFSASARSFRRAIFLPTAPARRAQVGTVARVVPVAEARTRPPAVVKVAVEMGSAKKSGWAMVMLIRQTARVTANKPWGTNINVEDEEWKIFPKSNLP